VSEPRRVRFPAFRPPPPAEFEAPPDRAQRNPVYRWMMHLGLPLGLSLILHAAIVGGASVYTFSVLARPTEEIGEYEAGLVPRLDERIDQAFRWDEQVVPEAAEVLPLQPWSLTEFSRVEPLDERALDSSGAGGGPGGGAGAGEFGLGEGSLSLLGTGAGAAAPGAGGFGSGLGGRGGQLGQAGIWDLRVRANKIVYVVDFSGSIIVAVDDLKRELKRSIGRLSPAQSFNVILFYSETEGGRERFQADAFAPQLQPATEPVRRAFFQWLDQRAPRGGTDPLPAIKRALSLGPEAVFLFSDGLFEDSLVDEITRANSKVQARIMCLVFDEILLQETSRMPRETDGARRMRRIAEQNRGGIKIVTGADLRP